MDNQSATKHRAKHRASARIGARTLAVTIALTMPALSYADRVDPPAVPASIQVPAGNRAILVGHAVGTQNYICLPANTGFAWTLSTPGDAFNDSGRQIITHYFSPNPDGKRHDARDLATLERHEHRRRRCRHRPTPRSSRRAPFPGCCFASSARTVVDRRRHPFGDDVRPSRDTSGGIAPSTGCSVSTEVGNRTFVPYTADYIFYSDR